MSRIELRTTRWRCDFPSFFGKNKGKRKEKNQIYALLIYFKTKEYVRHFIPGYINTIGGIIFRARKLC
jgi:hypothetical protein